MAKKPKRRVPVPASCRTTRAELLAVRNKTVPDIIGPRLKALFVGINPGLYSAAVRHHFARPGNRFWPALFRAGFTPRPLLPHEERELLKYGCGITSRRIPRRSSFGDGGSSAQ
jgi:TDG/mug DNA glycosylase family protein